MHTFNGKSVSIHYNSDASGDAFVTQLRRPVGEIRVRCRDLLDFAEHAQRQARAGLGYGPSTPRPSAQEVLGAFHCDDGPLACELALQFGRGWRRAHALASMRACVGLACFMAAIGAWDQERQGWYDEFAHAGTTPRPATLLERWNDR